MSQTLSRDLRSRVIAAVGGGMSCNAAVRRFGVGISTAIRWVREWRTTRVATAKPRGGDLRSHRIEAFREVLLSAIEAQPDLDPTRLVFIDETDASTKMARLQGRAKRGERCRSPVPRGHWMTTTFTGVLQLSGMTAPIGAGRADERRRLRSLCRSGSDPHTPARRDRHHEPHPPDLNPIENAFAKLKALLRKEAARTIDGLKAAGHQPE